MRALGGLKFGATILDGGYVAATSVDSEDQRVARPGVNDIVTAGLGEAKRGKCLRGKSEYRQKQIEKHGCRSVCTVDLDGTGSSQIDSTSGTSIT